MSLYISKLYSAWTIRREPPYCEPWSPHWSTPNRSCLQKKGVTWELRCQNGTQIRQAPDPPVHQWFCQMERPNYENFFRRARCPSSQLTRQHLPDVNSLLQYESSPGPNVMTKTLNHGQPPNLLSIISDCQREIAKCENFVGKKSHLPGNESNPINFRSYSQFLRHLTMIIYSSPKPAHQPWTLCPYPQTATKVSQVIYKGIYKVLSRICIVGQRNLKRPSFK